MRLVHSYKKTEILKYQIAKHEDPLDIHEGCYGGDSVRPTE